MKKLITILSFLALLPAYGQVIIKGGAGVVQVGGSGGGGGLTPPVLISQGGTSGTTATTAIYNLLNGAGIGASCSALGTDGSGNIVCIGGGGTVTGSGTIGYYSCWTGATALGNCHWDDGVTTAGWNTSSEPVAVNSTSSPSEIQFTYNTGHPAVPVAGSGMFGADSSGNATSSDNGGTFYHVCTIGNAVCALLSASNTFTGSLDDFSAVSQIKLPVTAAYASAANGEIGYDSTNLNWHVWDNGSDQYMAVFAKSGITSGHCVEFLQSTNAWSLQDAGAPCGTGSGLSGMTAGQVPIAATATTVTSSEALAGAGAGITTGPASGTTANDVVTMNGANGQIKDSGTLISALAPLASPTFTGVPAAPTATGGTSTTQLATTAFVQAAIAAAGTGAGIVTYSGPSLSLSGTQYLPIGGGGLASSTETNVDIDSPAAVTVQNMTVQMSAAPGVGNSVTYTWRKNASSTALTCTISGASATSCSDTTHNFTTVALDLLDIQTVTTGTIVGTPTVVMAAQLGVSAVATVSSFSGDGALLSNSLSTGAVTATLGNAAANTVWGNQTGGSTTPSYGKVALASHATQANDTVVMNATGSTASPTAVAMPTCTTGADLYNTTTHAWSCVSTGGAWTNITGSVTVSGCTVSSGACVVSGSSTATVTLSSIPGTYLGLRLVIYGQSVSGNNTILVNFNGDSTSGHYGINGTIQSASSSPSANAAASQGGCVVSYMTSGGIDTSVHELWGYAGTTFPKSITYQNSGLPSGFTLTGAQQTQGMCGWTQTSAITSIAAAIAASDYAAGTTFILYGIN